MDTNLDSISVLADIRACFERETEHRVVCVYFNVGDTNPRTQLHDIHSLIELELTMGEFEMVRNCFSFISKERHSLLQLKKG